jgi:hypothetical protein
MDEHEILHFEAVVLDDEAKAWEESRVSDVVTALEAVGVSLLGEADFPGWASRAGQEIGIPFKGVAGEYELLLDDGGGWWWDTPYRTLMQGRHTSRTAAVDELVNAVRAVVGAAPPYYGCTWYSNQFSPLWMRTTDAFEAQDGAAIQFFSRRYLDAHCGGKPYTDPPGSSEEIAGGQFLVADRSAFGEATVVALRGLTAFLQRYPSS